MKKTLDTVVTYFQANDTEELTSYDIKVKFNVPINGLNLMLQPGLKKQWLAKRINKHGDCIYLAGSLIGTYGWTEEAPNPAPSEVIYPLPIEQIDVQEPRAIVKPPRYGTPIKLSDIQIDNSIPLPGKTTSNLRTFQLLLGKLKPGHSAALPILSHSLLRTAITRTHKTKFGRYTLKKLPDQSQVRVWRIS
jgi:hypothetical protein